MNNNVTGPSLVLCDGLNILRRVYGANPAPDSSEKARKACSNAFSSFRRILTEDAPTYALAAFDAGGHTWRHDLMPAYHAGRKPMPEALQDELPGFIARLRNDLGLYTVAIPGVEADDVIGTVVSRWIERRTDAQAQPVIVRSTDKDLATLVEVGAQVRNPFEQELRDDAWIQKKFGVPARLLADLLALMGDTTDGVPGVEDVGVKTAAKLLNQYGSLEAVLEAASSIKGKLGEKLRRDADQARMARRLVALKTDVNVGVTWRDLRFGAEYAMAA